MDTCAVAECDKPTLARGWCNTHYHRWRRNGHPGLQPRPSLRERMLAKVDTTGTCWQWIAAQDGRGYGQIGVDGRLLGAHRVSYELHVGPIPAGLTLDHLCRNTLCVRPSHLEPVSMEENLRREAAAITQCDRGHDFTPENTIRTSSGRRRCRTCKNQWMRDRTRSKRTTTLKEI